QPTVVFRPGIQDQRQMIRMGGGAAAHLAVHGVNLRLEMPHGTPADGWSLFAVNTNQSLELADCVLTAIDGDDDELPIHEHAAMIAVLRRRPADIMSMMDEPLAMAQHARVSLNKCIARGEASLIRMTDETPLTLTWAQGLLATSRCLLE